MNREAEEFRISSDIKQANLELASRIINSLCIHYGTPITDTQQKVLDEARAFIASQQQDGFTHFPELLESVQQMDAMLKAEGAQGERKRFEAEVLGLGLPVERDHHGAYVSDHVRHLWSGWELRAALAQPSPAPELKCPEQVGKCPEVYPELERPEVVAWALQRKRDGFVRATWHQKPSETQYEIAELDGDVIAPLYAAPSVSTWKAPEGFALVPIEPTVAMRMPWKTMRGYSWHSKYKAMLAAAAVQRGEL